MIGQQNKHHTRMNITAKVLKPESTKTVNNISPRFPLLITNAGLKLDSEITPNNDLTGHDKS